MQVNAKKDIKTNLKVGDSVLKERNCITKPSVPSKKKIVITSKTDEKKGLKLKVTYVDFQNVFKTFLYRNQINIHKDDTSLSL